MKLPPSPAVRSQTQTWLAFSRTTPASRVAAAYPTRGVRLVYGIRATVLRMLVALVLAVAALAFVASFETISAFAVAIGWPAGLRWVAPLLVDTFTLVGTLLVIWLGLTGRNPWGCVAGYYGRLLIMIGTAASMIVNLDAHRSTLLAPGADATVSDAAIGAAVLAVGPPAALFLAVEALVIVARYALTDLTAAAEQVGDTRPVTAATAHARPAGGADRAHDLDDDRPAPVTLDRTDRPASATSNSIPAPGLPAGHAGLGAVTQAGAGHDRPALTGPAGDTGLEPPSPRTTEPGGQQRPAVPITDRPNLANGHAGTVRDRLAAAVAVGRPDGTPWTNRTLAAVVGCAPSTAGAFLRSRRHRDEEGDP